MRIADKGADLVRITVQGKKEADACFEIKNTLVQKKQAVIFLTLGLFTCMGPYIFLCVCAVTTFH